ncbi:MAG: YesL family protein [Lachnospiraceae bacterium]|nr:YesL family protein [Lachnospiraceae bacterium]
MFTYDNPVIRFLNKVADLLILNILFIICCLPIFTIGASISALYSVSLRSVRYGDGYVWKNFFGAFKENFKQSTIAWLIMFVVLVLLFLDIRFWQQIDMGSINSIMLGVSYVILFLWICFETWLFPVIAKMKDGLSMQFKNAAKMTIGYLIPYTLVCALIKFVLLYISYVNLPMLMVMFMIGFSTEAYICSFFIYKVFSKHIEEESLGYDDLLYKYEKEEEESKEEN